MFYQVGVGKEFKGKAQFEKTEKYFYGIQPAAGFGKRIQHIRKQCEQRKGQSNCYSEAGHAETKPHGAAFSAYHAREQRTRYRPRAGKGNDGKGKGHKKYSPDTLMMRFTVCLIGNARRKVYFIQTEKG